MELMHKNVDQLQNLFFQELEGHLNGPLQQNVLKAYRFAEEQHKDQYRDEGSPYIVHILRILIRFLQNERYEEKKLSFLLQVVALHDVLEDCDVSKEEIINLFGNAVFHMVWLLSSHIRSEQSKLSVKQYFQRLLDSSEEVKRIKVYDRLDNLYSLAILPQNEEKKSKTIRITKQWVLLLADSELQEKIHQAIDHLEENNG